MPTTRRFPFALLIGVALLASACAAPSGTFEDGALQEQLGPALVTLDEVLAATGAPVGLEEIAPDRANLREESNPRGPCGAEIDPLPVLDGAVAVFGQDDIVIVNVVLTATGGLAERLVSATAADLTPDCEPFEKEEAEFDAPQLTELTDVVDVSGLGDDGAAYMIKGTVGEADPAYGAQVLIRRGDDLSAIVILAAAPIDGAFVADLASAAAAGLVALTP